MKKLKKLCQTSVIFLLIIACLNPINILAAGISYLPATGNISVSRDYDTSISHYDIDYEGTSNGIVAYHEGEVVYKFNLCDHKNISNDDCNKGTGFGGYGNCVLIKHKANGSISAHYSFYAHLQQHSMPVLNIGNIILAGQKLANMGNSGQTFGKTGIHLHFEIRTGTWIPNLGNYSSLSHSNPKLFIGNTQLEKPICPIGDINLDYSITTTDIVMLLRYLGNTLTLTSEQFNNSDCFKEVQLSYIRINSQDLAVLQGYVVGDYNYLPQIG